MRVVIQLIAAFAGSLGFALLFNSKIKNAIIGALGGMCSWGIYLIGEGYFSRVFFICLLASCFAALFGEICARIYKAPATVFFIPAVVPLVPGSALYNTISNIVVSDWNKVKEFAFLTAEYAFAIAVGASFIWGMRCVLKRIIKK